ncbi:hypothetical protein C5615_38085 [Burkholderia cepacia]|uniref:DUF559 domain-containing protein n=1 Tax=Burkholderia cepacia TaxID=292 RepID=A0A2S8HWZ6_BURCE|nr:hypothetical protein C5615_38085 [Burkholderia cepacia]
MNRVSRHTFTRANDLVECVALREPLRNQLGFVFWSIDTLDFQCRPNMAEDERFIERNRFVFVVIEDHVVIEVDSRGHVRTKFEPDVAYRSFREKQATALFNCCDLDSCTFRGQNRTPNQVSQIWLEIERNFTPLVDQNPETSFRQCFDNFT